MLDFLPAAGVGPDTYSDGLIAGGVGAEEPDQDAFEAEDLVGEVSDQRQEELANGAPPTPEEMEIWMNGRAEAALESENAAQCDVWEVKRKAQPSIYAVTWRGDGGEIGDEDGPYFKCERNTAGAPCPLLATGHVGALSRDVATASASRAALVALRVPRYLPV